MRKQQEIELLDTLIQQTPRNSYLRSMLEHLRPQFESDIRSDFETMPNLVEMERERLKVAGEIRSRQLQLSALETKVQCLRAERGRLVGALNSLEHQTLQIENMIRVARKDWENLSL